MFKSKPSIRMSAGKVASAFCLVVGLLCVSKFVYALDGVANSQENSPHALTMEQQQAAHPLNTVPTVPTLPGVTPTSTPTATPTQSPPSVTVNTNGSSDGRHLNYSVVFTNLTGLLIKGAKTYFTVPKYTVFNPPASQTGWQCTGGSITGFGEGSVCEYLWGDISPNAEVASASLSASRQTTFVLDVLVDEVPPSVRTISFDIFVADNTGKIYNTFSVTSALSSTPTYLRYLPLIGRKSIIEFSQAAGEKN